MSDSQTSRGTIFLGKAASVKVRTELAKVIIQEENRTNTLLASVMLDQTTIDATKNLIREHKAKLKAAGKSESPYTMDILIDSVSDLVNDKLKKAALVQSHYRSDAHNVSYDVARRAVEKLLEGKKMLNGDYPHTKVSATTFESTNGDLEIRFNHEDGTVIWYVPENNHAHDEAMNSFLGHEFTKLMNKFEWTPRTGGVIHVHSEYDDDAGHLGEPRVVFAFGGLGGKLQNNEKAKTRTRPR
jgi:hypothetical protein